MHSVTMHIIHYKAYTVTDLDLFDMHMVQANDCWLPQLAVLIAAAGSAAT